MKNAANPGTDDKPFEIKDAASAATDIAVLEGASDSTVTYTLKDGEAGAEEKAEQIIAAAVKTKTPVKAKELSKWGIAFGVFITLALSLVRGLVPVFCIGKTFGMSQAEIIFLGLFCIASWSPVFLSMWFDKFLGNKKGASCAEG